METERPVPPPLPDKKPEVLGDLGSKLTPLRSAKPPTPSPSPSPLPIGAGLENLGNTCFLNAVLQCVTHTVPLLQSLQSSSPHPYPCSGNFINENGRFCSLCALRQHVDVCVHQRGGFVRPSGFVNNLSNISSSFSRYQQEDAHEFLHCLLDNLHSSCLDPDSADDPSLQKDSFIKQIFGGRLRSQIQCCDCGHCSDTYEPLLDLSLEIEDAESLEDALESFTKVEKIEDPEIKFTCEGCKAHVAVQKQFTLDQAPPVVALHLKRFKSNGYFADKIDKFVKYPRDLDLKPFHSNPQVEGDLKYELFAAVMHQGVSSLYGHYYCFIRPSPDLWYILDDEKVYRVNEENALSQSAYILFYVQQGTPWFSCLVEEEKMSAGILTSPVSVVDHVEAYRNSSSDSEDNFNHSVEDPESDENLGSCSDVSLDTVKKNAGRDDASPSPMASKPIASEIEGNQAHCAVNGHNAAPPLRQNYTRVDTDMNEGVSDASCLPRASQCNVPNIEGNQTDDSITNRIAAPDCRPSSSSFCDMNKAEGEHIKSPLGVTKCSESENKGNRSGGTASGRKEIAPCTPKQLYMDKFCDETWEEVEKENSLKLLANSEAGKSAMRTDNRELAILKSYLRSMPRSRRIGLEQFVHPGRSPSSTDHQRRKRKLHLDSESSPCRSSNATRASSGPLSSSVLHELVARDDSHFILAVNSNQRGKRK